MRTRPSYYRSLPGLASVTVLMAAGVLVCTAAWAQTAPRIPRLPMSQIPSGALLKTTVLPGANGGLKIGSQGINALAYSLDQKNLKPTDPQTSEAYNAGGKLLTITQNAPAAILNWGSFDISADAKVNIIQPSSTAVMLNRIEGNVNKSIIEGVLEAPGHVYIYNPNGIVFGKTARINVNSLFATSLNIQNDRFLSGILSPNQAPIFAADVNYAGPLGDAPGSTPGDVVVLGDASGKAELTADRGGKIVLVAPKVMNNGILSAPDGQVILAAGGKVYLSAPESTDLGMRGLLVEVNSSNLKLNADGTRFIPEATNGPDGKIFVERGNASMIGLAVNQMGTVSATTSINLNGSIFLRARDGAVKESSGEKDFILVHEGGKLVLGEGSLTQVSIFDDKLTASAGPENNPSFKKSRIDLTGQSIMLKEKAHVIAAGGDVTITARMAPSGPTVLRNESRVDFGAGSVIDVSGTAGTKLAMESNVIEVQLLSELADNVLMRNSALRGKKMRFDIRKGSNIADISKAIAKLEGAVGERTAAGGTVKVISEGEIIQRGKSLTAAASLINVSGSQIEYLSGYVNTTKLTANGGLFDLSTAALDKIYDGYVNLPNGGRNFEAGYTVGKDAGTVQFSAPTIVLQGELKGTATPGLYQREVGAVGSPLGGKLIIGADTINPYLGKIMIGGTTTGAAIAPGVDESFNVVKADDLVVNPTPNPDHQLLFDNLDIDTVKLKNSGFSRLTASTAGNIDLVAPIALTAGAELNLGATGAIAFKSGISMPGGTLSASAMNITVDQGVTFDLAGKWTNDTANANPERDAAGNPTGKIVLNGGKFSLAADSEIVIGNNVAIDVSGGAWLDASRKLKAGAAGSISIKGKIDAVTTSIAPVVQLGDKLSLSAYGLVKGGSLALQGRNVTIGGLASPVDQQDLWLPEKFFEQGGFANYDIGAFGHLNVTQDSVIKPSVLNWQFKNLNGYKSVASGAMRDVAAPVKLALAGPLGSRAPTNVTLRAISETVAGAGELYFGKGAQLIMDPGAKVTLLAGRQLTIDGAINTPGGTIVLGLTPAAGAISSPYSETRSIWFGHNSQMLARGSDALLYTEGNGITTGEVLDGGRIQVGGLDANGKLVAATGYVVVEQGAIFDVSGATSKPVSFKSGHTITAAQPVASAGGSIDIRAREGLLIAGNDTNGKSTFAGAGGTGVQGGSLSFTLDTENTPFKDHITPARILTLTADSLQGMTPNGYQSGLSIQDLVGGEGKGLLSTKSFETGGFDRLAFKSQDELAFALANGSQTLNAKTTLTLDAPVISATDAANKVQLNAAYVQMGSADYRYQTPGASVAGAAMLDVNATTIDLIGNSALSGFGTATMKAKEDIRLVGMLNFDVSSGQEKKNQAGLLPTGELKINGDLTLNAAQIYPTTLSTFTLNAVGVPGKQSTLTFTSNGNAAQTPFSAGGNLIGKADNIIQSGRVAAPFGSISLIANEELTYTAGSTTSVAGAGLIPFGRVENGRDWLYDFGAGNSVAFKLNPSASGILVERNLQEKSITSKAPTIITKEGATLDLSGGGELYAYEFTAGSNGTKDVLKNNDPGSATKVFAINPNFKGSVAPRDYQYGQDGGLLPGDSVYLSGIDGLAAGTYTLLPAHYALLPGGMSITLAPNSRDMATSSNVANLDGSMTVAGRRTVLGAGDTRTSGWTVSNGDVIRSKSDFQEYTASAYFKEQAIAAGVTVPMLPIDGGRVAFDAAQKLTLDGNVRLDAAAGGRRGSADISAPEIVVVSDDTYVPKGSELVLLVDKLTALGADSLLLGGLRDGVTVSVGANNVTIQNDKDHVLSGPEIILAAKESVLIADKAVVKGEGTLSQAPRNLVIQDADINDNDIGTDGALLRVSGGAAVSVTRNAPNLVRKGNLDISAGATVAATGSAYLDATNDNKLEGKLDLAAGAALGLGASRISLGSDIPAVIDGLHFDTTALATLSQLSALELSSYSTIDLWGTVNLGNAAMKKLTLKGSGFQGYGSALDDNSRQASFTAETVRFDGGSNFTLTTAAPVNAAGLIKVQASDIEFGNDAFLVKGYADAKLSASREARAAGTGRFSTEKDMTLAAGRIVANGYADATIEATGGKLMLTTVANAEAPAAGAPLGGRLHFIGDTIESNALIQTPAGSVKMTATGGKDIDGNTVTGVNITGGNIYAGGASVVFGSTTAYAQGGRITLDGGQGHVIVGKDATLDVSAMAAAGGTVAVKATNDNKDGKVILDGTLLGRGAGRDGDEALPNQGSFVMDVDKLAEGGQFDTLNAKLDRAAFSEARSFRVRHDDVTLSENKKIKAHDVLIAADNGSITINGKIDASGIKGGSIELYASQEFASGNSGNVTLGGNASLNAYATFAGSTDAGSSGDGGRVVIGTGSADGLMQSSYDSGSYINLDGGVINVGGSGLGRNGSVTLRAPRVGSSDTSGSDVAISRMDAIIHGSAETVIEAYKTYTTSKISAAADQLNEDGTYSNLQAAQSSIGPITYVKDNSKASKPLIATATTTTAGMIGKPAGLMYTEASDFASNNAINSRLGRDDASVRAGIEVRSIGDLLISVNEVNQGVPLDINGQPIYNAATVNLPPVRGKTPAPVALKAPAALNPLDRGWNLNEWRFNDGLGNSAPGTLTLRATGDLIVNGSISDGFVKPAASAANNKLSMPDWKLGADASWSYRLAGGADFAAASPLAVVASTAAVVANDAKGDVKINFARTSGTATDTPVALVRTGTGRIDVAAARDVVLQAIIPGADPYNFVDGDPYNIIGATIYTAGMHKDVTGNFTVPTNQNNTLYGSATGTIFKTSAEFSNNGGAIAIHAARDVVGAPVPQLINNWLFRQGHSLSEANNSLVRNTAWWSRFDYFNQGIATFGGGDISVIADTGNVKDVSASVATNAYMTGSTFGPTVNMVESGGGDLVVRAGNDILGGTFYVQKGKATLTADSSIKAGSMDVFARNQDGTKIRDANEIDMPKAGTLKTILALGDARVNVNAGRDLEVETAFNPTLTDQSKNNWEYIAANPDLVPAQAKQQFSNFSTYGDSSAVYLTAIAGNVLLSNNTDILKYGGGKDMYATILEAYNPLYVLQPGKFRAAAMGGDLTTQGHFSLIGTPRGQLDLLAAGTVSLGSIAMVDVGLDKISPYYAPRLLRFPSSDGDLLKGTVNGLAGHTSGGLHTGDTQPVRIIAKTGDITGAVNLPKKAEISAGRDIVDLAFTIQNMNASDVTRVTAGRDFIDTTKNAQNAMKHTVAGSGRVDFIAGRNFDLGDGDGVVTRGNLDNPYLASGGAGINILAGSNKADYGNFAKKYIAASDLTAADQTAMIAYVRARQPELSVSATPAIAWDAFKGLSDADQNAFLDAHKPAINKIFFAKLVESSKVAGLSTFDSQIASLYTNINPNGGNINVFASQLKTEQGGSIDMFAPGGSLYAGLVSTPAYLKLKSASDNGIFTIRGGDINALVKTDFLVNQGRVFTLGGGDIAGVSQYGDLNAGKGEKTASSAPPPLLTTDDKGNTKLEIAGSITGSGIATLKTDQSLPDSDVIMIAPRGTFDAGDAGVRSTGSVQINAAVVLNAGNISASGSVSGAPSVDAGAASSAAAPSSASTKVDDVAKNLNNLPATAAGPSNTLSVDVLGFGPDGMPATGAGSTSTAAGALDCSDPKNKDGCAAGNDSGKKK